MNNWAHFWRSGPSEQHLPSLVPDALLLVAVGVAVVQRLFLVKAGALDTAQRKELLFRLGLAQLNCGPLTNLFFVMFFFSFLFYLITFFPFTMYTPFFRIED